MPNILESEEQLTVQQLLDCLQKLVKKDPSMKNAKVFQIEFGGIKKTFVVGVDTHVDTYDENEIHKILVISGGL